MHLLFLSSLFLCLRTLTAATTNSSTSHSNVTHSTNSTNTTATIHRPVVTTSKPHSVHVVSTSGVGKFSITHATPQQPQHTLSGTDPPPPAFKPDHPVQSTVTHQKPALIFFEVLGGVVAFVLLLGFLRCLISYGKTPDHDRVAYFIHRHQLQREMEELERNPPIRNRSSLIEPPPPPYHPPPPSYQPEHVSDDHNTPLTEPHSGDVDAPNG